MDISITSQIPYPIALVSDVRGCLLDVGCKLIETIIQSSIVTGKESIRPMPSGTSLRQNRSTSRWGISRVSFRVNPNTSLIEVGGEQASRGFTLFFKEGSGSGPASSCGVESHCGVV